jgi:predicted RecB family nuclease
MQLLDGRLIYSASDLNNYLACEYLTSLDIEVTRGVRERPEKTSGQAPLLAKLGEEHEQNYLQQLRAKGHEVTVVARGWGVAGFIQAAIDTEAAMARGDEFIYQATFFDADWVGHADFLRKIPLPLDGGRWGWHYEVEDTKLARHTEPYFLLQLAYYSEHVARLQGAPAANMHVVLGNGNRVTFRIEDVSAYYRSVRSRFEARIAQTGWQPYPAPIEHCGLCVWGETCEQRWKTDDHLSLVANITRLQVSRLNDVDVTTLHGLATAGEQSRPVKMVAPTFERLHRQARLQHEQRLAVARGDDDPYRYEILKSGIERKDETDPLRGFFRLPDPSPGDMFFDMEGDPYFDIGTGLEYMFGVYTVADGFQAYWGCDRSANPGLDRLAEKRAFEAFIDDVMKRRKRDPGMHVYHYASISIPWSDKRSPSVSRATRSRRSKSSTASAAANRRSRRAMIRFSGSKNGLRFATIPRAATITSSKIYSGTTNTTASPPTDCVSGCSSCVTRQGARSASTSRRIPAKPFQRPSPTSSLSS